MLQCAKGRALCQGPAVYRSSVCDKQLLCLGLANRSVPSGRVGNAKDAIFRSNDHFRQAVAEREECDVAELQHRLDRSLEKAERARIGVGQLRRFLEQLLQRRYIHC